MPNPKPPQASPPRALRWAVAGSVVVMIAAGALFYYASQLAASKRQINHDEVQVTIHPHSCEPNALTVPAGRASFRIVNRSDRAVEWEILDGVLVVEERENIAPGLSQVINAKLLPGDYTITCGLLSNPRGTLHVTATAASDAAAKAKPAMAAFVGPLSEFRVYLSSQSSALIKAVAALQQAIDAGDLSQAQALYAPARAAYQRIAPAAQRFAELDNAINARADYFEKREQDPAFVGFHRLEFALFQQRSLDGLTPISQRLLADVTALKQQLLAYSLPPEQLVDSVVRNLDSLSNVRAGSGEEERYSHTDLNGFAANLMAARKVVDLLRPLLSKSNTDLLMEVDTAANAFDAQLNGLKVAQGYARYDSVSAGQRQQIADKAKALSAALNDIDPALGLSGLETPTMNDSDQFSAQRRRVLLGMGAAGVALAGSALSCPAMAASAAQVTEAPSSDNTEDRQPFHGKHQSGIVTPRPASGMLVSFDVLASDRDDLQRLFRTLNERIAFLMKGGPVEQVDPKLPPVDSGILGPVVTPDNLTITVSVGESLFDERFGLKAAKPRRLSRMVGFPNDALDADCCHGDLSLQFCANTADTNIHALRDIVKNLPDLLLVRWKQEGSVPPQAPSKPRVPAQSARNFLGFRDGSANPDSNDATAMDSLVWVQPGSDEPAWAAHGSYQAVRIIRNFVERWDRTPLQEQESILGRIKTSGAPIGGTQEAQVPDYSQDPHGKLTRLDAHIRLANPRTAASQANLILRRPFNYSNGVNKNGQLDMGLLFICYQADLEKGFVAVQNRLNGEPLEEYLKPVGGGYFFTLPGVTGDQDYIGRSLLAATQSPPAV